MLDQFGNHIPGTAKSPPRQQPGYTKVDQVGDESFFVKKNPYTGVITKMIYHRKTGEVKVRKSMEIAPDMKKAADARNHAATKRAYAGGKHQPAYLIPHNVRQEMLEKISANGFEYDVKEFYKMLDGSSRYGDYSCWKILKGKMPNLKKEV